MILLELTDGVVAEVGVGVGVGGRVSDSEVSAEDMAGSRRDRSSVA